MEFFTIVLPGGALIYFGKPLVTSKESSSTEALQLAGTLGGAEPVIIFLFASYLAGHVVFLIGAKVLDDWVYQPVRDCTDKVVINRICRGRKLPPNWRRRIARLVFPRHPDRALLWAIWIKSKVLVQSAGGDAINAFQWSKLWLAANRPEGVAEVQRYEADSKFFRSFSVVLVLLALGYIINLRPDAALLCLLLLGLAVWRYADLRFKSTEQAYRYVIALGAGTEALNRPRQEDEPTHAGGAVYRIRNGAVEYLLTEARREREQWVLPKGHVEAWETPRETAVREVREETGYWARAVKPIGNVHFAEAPMAPLVRFYLMELIDGRRDSESEERSVKWLSLPKAIERLTFDEAKELLEQAERVRIEPHREGASG